ncbi:hypothetical protein [Jiella avicenniae]|uniref:Lipoprotein n=1 Tax=Jiella avicenniae TaxID=2907202 RepID=A0A9X1T491_9HYPH|nr:hypothetical protein [Jiella avicenniae]MCE7028361.1 hypothetical protein [Jiella avicenniae]
MHSLNFMKYCFPAAMMLLAGCVSPVVDETGPLNVTSVSVVTAPTVQSETVIGPKLQAAVSETIVGKDPAGKPSTVAIKIESVFYKNALLSALAGSSNFITTEVTIADLAGNPLKVLPLSYSRDAAINGVIGAAISLLQEKALVDQRLVEGYSQEIQKRIYGPPGHVPAVKAQPAKTPAAAPQPAPAPTAAPAGVPTS